MRISAGRHGCEAARGDARGNAVFPHFDAQGLSGWESKNTGFTGFAAGGTKGLWFSRTQADDARLVFCESSIDALSHAALFPDDRTRYASIGGKPNPQQPELIRAAIARMPSGSEIVAAMDADADGAKLAAVVRQAVALSGRDDPTIADSILDRLVHNAHRIELDGESMRKGRGGKPLQQ